VTEPMSFDEEAEKLMQRRLAGEQMQRDAAVWMGDCSQCWLPLPYPPIAIPKLETLRWSTQNPDQVELEREFLCVDCARPALDSYTQRVQDKPPEVGGASLSVEPS